MSFYYIDMLYAELIGIGVSQPVVRGRIAALLVLSGLVESRQAAHKYVRMFN